MSTEEKTYSVKVSAQPTGVCSISSCGVSSVEVANALDSAREYARTLLDNDASRTSSRILITELCSLCNGTQEIWTKKGRKTVRLACTVPRCMDGKGTLSVVHDEYVTREQGSVMVVDPIPAPPAEEIGAAKPTTKKLTVRLPKKDAVPQLAFDVDGKDVPLSELIEAYRLLTAREMEPLLEAARDGKAVVVKELEKELTVSVTTTVSIDDTDENIEVEGKGTTTLNIETAGMIDDITYADDPKVAQACLFNRRVLHGF